MSDSKYDMIAEGGDSTNITHSYLYVRKTN